MKKTEYKKAVLRKAKEKVKETIAHFKEEIAQIKESEMITNQGQFDDTEQSQNEASHEVMNSLALQVNMALDQLRTLESILDPEALLESVSFGAIVKTDKRIFFISVGIESFQIEGQTVFGISTEAPIYGAMKGKRKGERFSYRDVQYLIEAVF